jgi:hypothetical protein
MLISFLMQTSFRDKEFEREVRGRVKRRVLAQSAEGAKIGRLPEDEWCRRPLGERRGACPSRETKLHGATKWPRTSIFQDLGCGVWLPSDDRGECTHKNGFDVTPLTGLDGGKSINLFPKREGGLKRQAYREPLRLRVRESCPKLKAK